MRRNSPFPIPFSGASYAKDCIPLENKCNVTVVTEEGKVEMLGRNEGASRGGRDFRGAMSDNFVNAGRDHDTRRENEDVREKNGVNRRKRCRVTPIKLTSLLESSKPLPLSVVVEAEQVHQIADRWTIQRNVGVARVGHGVVEIVAAATG